MDSYEKYQKLWSSKTKKQIEKEIISMTKYIQKHAAHYAFQGNQTHPDELTDGLRLLALKELIEK